ncbi:hypothetical protein L218DRAFT_138621 [Marasmius fiardii PR-910]|nr:hypothetical protein L218DRAFT_138621 [Marasmius fiardii PR-910]
MVFFKLVRRSILRVGRTCDLIYWFLRLDKSGTNPLRSPNRRCRASSKEKERVQNAQIFYLWAVAPLGSIRTLLRSASSRLTYSFGCRRGEYAIYGS